MFIQIYFISYVGAARVEQEQVDRSPSETWGSYSSVDEESTLLGCYAVTLGEAVLMFHKHYEPSKCQELLTQPPSVISHTT